MLRHFERTGRPPVGMCDEDMWRARKVVEATCHPESGEMIAAPLRFSAFAPSNLIICAGMLRPNPTLMQSAWWQFVNQSYNAGVNYANRASGVAATAAVVTAASLGTAASSAVEAALRVRT